MKTWLTARESHSPSSLTAIRDLIDRINLHGLCLIGVLAPARNLHEQV